MDNLPYRRASSNSTSCRFQITYPKARNVTLTTSTEIPNRRELLNWINGLTINKYTTVEDLFNGSAYCLLINQLFPGIIPESLIKKDAIVEVECLQNFKMLQNAFNKVGLDKDIPLLPIVQRKIPQNLEFVQWFYLMFKSNQNSIGSTQIIQPKFLKHRSQTFSNLFSAGDCADRRQTLGGVGCLRDSPKQGNNTLVRVQIDNLHLQIEEKETEIKKLSKTNDLIEREKCFYFHKLRLIEEMVSERKELQKHTLRIDSDGFQIPNDDA